MTTALAPAPLRQHVVDLCVELRAHADVRGYLVAELAADDYLGERLTLATLLSALDRPGMTDHVRLALDEIGSYAQAGGDKSYAEHQHPQGCAFDRDWPDCAECEQHWQTLLDEALDRFLDKILTRQAVEDLRAVAA